MILPEWHHLIQWQKNLRPIEWKYLSLVLHWTLKVSFCYLFYYSSFSICNKRKSVTNTRGWVLAKPFYNTIGTARRWGSKTYLEQTRKILKAREHLGPTANFTFFQYLFSTDTQSRIYSELKEHTIWLNMKYMNHSCTNKYCHLFFTGKAEASVSEWHLVEMELVLVLYHFW